MTHRNPIKNHHQRLRPLPLQPFRASHGRNRYHQGTRSEMTLLKCLFCGGCRSRLSGYLFRLLHFCPLWILAFGRRPFSEAAKLHCPFRCQEGSQFCVFLGNWHFLFCRHAYYNQWQLCQHLNAHHNASTSWRPRSFFLGVGPRSSPQR